MQCWESVVQTGSITQNLRRWSWVKNSQSVFHFHQCEAYAANWTLNLTPFQAIFNHALWLRRILPDTRGWGVPLKHSSAHCFVHLGIKEGGNELGWGTKLFKLASNFGNLTIVYQHLETEKRKKWSITRLTCSAATFWWMISYVELQKKHNITNHETHNNICSRQYRVHKETSKIARAFVSSESTVISK